MRTKSGMGTDVDLIRMLLLIGTFAAPLYALRDVLDHLRWWQGTLLGGGICCGIALGWWVTRCWYLDVIEMEKDDEPSTTD